MFDRNPKLAPIAVFVYNRPAHARRALESLLLNPEATESPITVYCDGPRKAEDEEYVAVTRRVVRELIPSGARVVLRESNLGLANSIISGVTEQCEGHGRTIVIEDDLVLSLAAVRYLNDALDRYRDEERVQHVSAYMFPVKGPLPPAFFYREATCWGWATWDRAWKHFEPDPAVIQEFVLSKSLVHEFDIRGSMYFWEMLEQQRTGQIDSWAVRWYGSMFMQGGLALHPYRALVRNEGFDGTGEHCGRTSEFDVELSESLPMLPGDIVECEEAVLAMIEYRSRPPESPARERLLTRFRRRLKRTVRDFLDGVRGGLRIREQ